MRLHNPYANSVPKVYTNVHKVSTSQCNQQHLQKYKLRGHEVTLVLPLEYPALPEGDESVDS